MIFEAPYNDQVHFDNQVKYQQELQQMRNTVPFTDPRPIHPFFNDLCIVHLELKSLSYFQRKQAEFNQDFSDIVDIAPVKQAPSEESDMMVKGEATTTEEEEGSDHSTQENDTQEMVDEEMKPVKMEGSPPTGGTGRKKKRDSKKNVLKSVMRHLRNEWKDNIAHSKELSRSEKRRMKQFIEENRKHQDSRGKLVDPNTTQHYKEWLRTVRETSPEYLRSYMMCFCKFRRKNILQERIRKSIRLRNSNFSTYIEEGERLLEDLEDIHRRKFRKEWEVANLLTEDIKREE